MRCVNFFVTSAYNSDRTYSLSHFVMEVYLVGFEGNESVKDQN